MTISLLTTDSIWNVWTFKHHPEQPYWTCSYKPVDYLNHNQISVWGPPGTKPPLEEVEDIESSCIQYWKEAVLERIKREEEEPLKELALKKRYDLSYRILANLKGAKIVGLNRSSYVSLVVRVLLDGVPYYGDISPEWHWDSYDDDNVDEDIHLNFCLRGRYRDMRDQLDEDILVSFCFTDN